MITEYETTVSKIIYYNKNKKTNFWRISMKFHLLVPLKVLDHRCGPAVNSHAAGLGSFPGQVKSRLGFFPGFPSTVRKKSGNLRHIRLRSSYDHHIIIIQTIYHPTTDGEVSDLSCSTRSCINGFPT